jgi:hypothetical protein
MMASSTRCCRRPSDALKNRALCPGRAQLGRAWLTATAALRACTLALVATWLALATPLAAAADGIEVKTAAFRITEEGGVLEAEFEITLNQTLEGALSKGIPLYFVLDFELIRPRWYWVNEKVAASQQQYRLSYNALTRQYRISVGSLYQNFATLAEALSFMSRVRRREDLEPGILRKDASYAAAVRLRLDTTQLPKPFQLNTLGSRDWNLGSEWYRWSISP